MSEPPSPILFPVLSDRHLQDLQPCGEILELQPGDILYQEGDLEYCFYIVLSGKIKITKYLGLEEIQVNIFGRGEFTGNINMLAGGVSQVTASSVDRSRVVQFQNFKELLKGCPNSIDIFIPALVEHSKALEFRLRQQEKLAELGKLSAGLAHELNNPAAAGCRAAKQLNSAIVSLQQGILAPGAQNFSARHRQLLGELQQRAANREYYPSDLTPLKQSTLEDELADWLESLGVSNAWDLSPSFVSVGIGQSHLETLSQEMESAAFAEAVTWLEATLTVNNLVQELEFSTSQISDLVGAIKNYSYLNRSTIQEVDIHQSLDNTLKILHHKLKYGIKVIKEYSQDLPKVTAYGGELNQVWTNLIDNAIYAMNSEGELTIRTNRENNCILIEIIDNGSGIPSEIQSQIFEPFFTSKGVGKGSGLGLDISRGIIVNKHKGNLRFESQPGKTNFQIRIPIKQYS